MAFIYPEKNRIVKGVLASDTGEPGAFLFEYNGRKLYAIASSALGWEHVSISLPGKTLTPSWDEMCFIKSQFWEEEDAVIQFHPPKSQYVNNHKYCLHLWRPVGKELPLPPTQLVGFK